MNNMSDSKKDILSVMAEDLLKQAVKSMANEMVDDVAGKTRDSYSSDPYRDAVNDLIYREIKEVFNEKKSIVRDIIRQSLVKKLNESLLSGNVSLDVDRATKFVKNEIKLFKDVREYVVHNIVYRIIEEARSLDLDPPPRTKSFHEKRKCVLDEIRPKEGMLLRDKEGNVCTVSFYKNKNSDDFENHCRVTGPNFPGGFDLGWALIEGLVVEEGLGA